MSAKTYLKPLFALNLSQSSSGHVRVLLGYFGKIVVKSGLLWENVV